MLDHFVYLMIEATAVNVKFALLAIQWDQMDYALNVYQFVLKHVAHIIFHNVNLIQHY